jgi:hypothetical protein
MKPAATPVKPASPLVDPWDAFVARLSRKSLASVEAHVEACEGNADIGYGRQWKRLASMLGKLAGHAIEASGQHVLRFYIADGKYRQQVFTLEDARKGTIQLFLPDIIDLAIARHLLAAPKEGDRAYSVPGQPDVIVDIDRITSESKDVPEFVRPMLGWGRRALKITLQAQGEDDRLQAVGRLCDLAAEAWPKASELPPPVVPT